MRDGGKLNRGAPGPVPGRTCVAKIAAGGFYKLALSNDGTVWSWGRNDSGQLGNGNAANAAAPVQATGLASVTAVSAG